MSRYFKRDVETLFNKWLDSDCVLEVLGARQVGKTTTILNFSKNNFKNIIYVNLSYDNSYKFKRVLNNTNTYLDEFDSGEFEDNMVRAGYINYKNSKDTVIIIDEVQLDEHVYNYVRILKRSLKSRLIVTGSYLARALYDKKFFIPAGDVMILEMTSMSFREFLRAFEVDTNFLDSQEETITDSKKIRKLFDLYTVFGGYPKVVEALVLGSVEDAFSNISNIMRTFIQESKNYTEFIDDAFLLDNALCSIVKIIMEEKKGNKNLYEIIRNRINDNNSNRVSTNTCKNIITWLCECGVIGFCNKYIITDCRDSFKYDKVYAERIFFKDLGIFNYYMKMLGFRDSDVCGKRAENYVYKVLSDSLSNMSVIDRLPSFAVYKDYEFDFFIIKHSKRYLFEVKSGDGKSKSMEKAKHLGLADYYFYLGDVSNDVHGNGATLNLYMAESFRFEESTLYDKMQNELDLLKEF